MELDLNVHTEERLIEQSRKDPRAFKELYEFYFNPIFNFILKRVNDREVTSDMTQQVFFKALFHIKKYEYRGQPYSAFLYRVAVNECNAYFRDRSKARFVTIDPSDSMLLGTEFGYSEDEDEQKISRLKRVIKQLDHPEVMLLELRFFEKKAFKEIAYILNVTENLAKVRTYRLLHRMKKMMEHEKE